jgi:hypothetical protein
VPLLFVQLEDRILLLLATWADSSILTTTYLQGLEMMFMESEQEHASAQALLKSTPQQSPEASADAQSLLESVRRQARLAGLHFTPQSSLAYLQYRLQQIAQFQQRKSKKGGLYGANRAVFAQQVVQEEEDDDIDGVEMEYDPLAENTATTASKTSVHRKTPAVMLSTNSEAAVDDDDDIDGMALDEDVDGVPMDDEDIDGVPM